MLWGDEKSTKYAYKFSESFNPQAKINLEPFLSNY
jgi:hypothetical protein